MHIKETQERVKIDETDKNILKILVDNARASMVDIGKAIKINPKVVANRIKKWKI